MTSLLGVSHKCSRRDTTDPYADANRLIQSPTRMSRDPDALNKLERPTALGDNITIKKRLITDGGPDTDIEIHTLLLLLLLLFYYYYNYYYYNVYIYIYFFIISDGEHQACSLKIVR